ncbi:MAG: tRNA (adenosine(37)-N6)-threonylcarbamoyltransferase complex dimerization subunit type 1 TsaB [Shimia sp.]
MPLLAVDTSGAYVALALFVDEDITVDVTDMAKGQAEALFPLAEGLLKDAGLTWQSLDRLAVCTGPGNFTGIRIGVSAVRGLALSLDIPAIGISTFEAVAELVPGTLRVTCPTPWGAVYLADPAQPELAEIADPAKLDTKRFARAEDHSPEARIRAITALARGREAAAPPAPLYIRPADAAPPKDAPPVILAG